LLFPIEDLSRELFRGVASRKPETKSTSSDFPGRIANVAF
jgi:hypothetical protein